MILNPLNLKKLLGLTIDNCIRLDHHISNLCSKVAMQLNALGWLQKHMERSEKFAIVNSIIYTNFNYCPLDWYFSTVNRSEKSRKSKNVAWEIVLDDYDNDYDVLGRKVEK